MKKLINDFIKNEDGVTAIEYAVMGVGLAIILGTIFGKDGKVATTLSDAFDEIAKKLKVA